ncbi:MAG: hypothetical protein K6T37_07795 [Acidothermus cellulolyticus]|nr:hypothetical protein [Acidothermus cellulolyticus]
MVGVFDEFLLRSTANDEILLQAATFGDVWLHSARKRRGFVPGARYSDW